MYILFKYLIELIFFLFLAVLHFYWHSYILCDFLLVLVSSQATQHCTAYLSWINNNICYSNHDQDFLSHVLLCFLCHLFSFFFLNLYIYNILLSLFLVKKKTMLVFIFRLCSAIANKDALSRQASYMHASLWFFFFFFFNKKIIPYDSNCHEI